MNNLLPNSWPPTYRLKRHRRARAVKLHASETYGLEITLPMRFSLKHLPEILEENKQWILAKLGRRAGLKKPSLPSQLSLRAMNQVWQIQYVNDAHKIKIKKIAENTVQVSGNIAEQKEVQHKLLQWIKKEAQPFLEKRLYNISQQLFLPYKAVKIRRQKTLWGSCTIEKHISLNLKLIFLPIELVDYIIIHELCHTKHLDHSNAFWKLVEKYDEEWRMHRKEMRDADQFIPIELFM